MQDQRVYLPVALNISHKKILLVGGGKVALEKITSLKRYTKHIFIVSEKADKEVREAGYPIQYKSYEASDLEGFFLVYACTNEQQKNEEIRSDCHARHILVNVVDNPSRCDFVSPAIYKYDQMSVAVSSNGQNVKRSIQWRNAIRDHFKEQLHKL